MKKKLVAIILVAAVAIGGGVFSYFHFFNSHKTMQAYEPPRPLRGIVDEDDVGHISLREGDEAIEVRDCDEIWLTPDKKKIVVLDTSGNLYWMHPDKKDEEIIAKGIDVIYDVGDKAVFYSTNGGDFGGTTYTADEGLTFEGYSHSYTAGNQNGYIVNRTDNGSTLFTIDPKSGEFDVFASSDNDIRVVALNDSKNFFLWAEEDDNGYYQVRMTQDGKDKDLFEIPTGEELDVMGMSSQLVGDSPYGVYTLWYDGMYSRYDDDFDHDQKEILNTIYYYDESKEDTPIELNGVCFNVYTKNGYLTCEDSLDDEYYAVTIDANDYRKYADSYYYYYEEDESDEEEKGYTNLEYFNEDGDVEVLLEDLKECYVSNGYAYFIDEDDVLVEAELDGDSIKKARKIDEDVTDLNDCVMNGYVYYFKSSGRDGLYDLYAYKHGNKPERVEKKVKPLTDFSSYYYSKDTNTCTSPTGDTVYFYKNIDEFGDDEECTGTLCKYTYGGKVKEIAEDVFVYYTFAPNYNKACTTNFTYLVVMKTDDGYADVKYFYYDGRKSYSLGKDFKIRY